MKILVIGGTHGNEPLGLKVAELLTKKPIKNVDAVLANEMAIKKGCRFIKTDLNRTFPGDKRSSDYEQKRAAELLLLCKKYDLVLDFHNTHCPNNDCTFVGEKAKDFLFNISSWLGLKRVIVADYNCINKYAVNCLSIEISLSSRKMNAQYWYKQISSLAIKKSVDKQVDVEKYRFAHRITLEERDKLDLKSKNLKAFRKINEKIANAMSVRSPSYAIFIGDGYTPYNYGGIISRVI